MPAEVKKRAYCDYDLNMCSQNDNIWINKPIFNRIAVDFHANSSINVPLLFIQRNESEHARNFLIFHSFLMRYQIRKYLWQLLCFKTDVWNEIGYHNNILWFIFWKYDLKV